ncbi:2-dehydro-3-deoxygalactonokinase [Thalassotalea sp. PLHSN55]|uniref:2-dehydro-3-deoxygalactonokinase n=1 Tax=Thalassotalea sp. PLHSN55 TaxID=3435888 RepID=UPI003F85A8C7
MSHIIFVDWGTSQLRAYLCQYTDQDEFEHISSIYGLGVSKCGPNFQQELMTRIQPWVDIFGKLPIYLAGQIGSSIGWKETQYLPCPTTLNNIAHSCVKFNSQQHQISVVPGLSCFLEQQYYDVMRGEEIQILGWLSLDSAHRQGQHLLCLPGTHTKWVLIEDGKVVLFKTAITGELFDLLSSQSVLVQQQKSTIDKSAFIKGAKFTLDSEHDNFSHGLIAVRSQQLFGDISNEQGRSYLSGFLIGSDVRAAIHAKQWSLTRNSLVNIIGDKRLSQNFADVFALQSINSKCFGECETTLAGFYAVYRQSIN